MIDLGVNCKHAEQSDVFGAVTCALVANGSHQFYKTNPVDIRACNNSCKHREAHNNNECQRCGSKTHVIAECPIPADTSSAKERAKSRQGGCCGAPSKVS